MSLAVDNPIVNSPFEEPARCLKILRARFLSRDCGIGMAACGL
jgi:hypothetical protein